VLEGSQYGIDTGAEVTDVKNSARRIESATPLSSSLDPSRLNRAKAASIFLFVTGDFWPRIRQVFRQMDVIVPGAVPRVSQRKTCGNGRFVNTGVEDMIGEKSYSQFSYPVVYRLLL